MEDESDGEKSRLAEELLQDFPDLENESAGDTEFQVISSGIHTDEEWTDLARFLGFNDLNTNILRYNFYAKGIQKTCLEMLKSWKQKRRTEANKKKLCEGLFRINRQDLVAALTGKKNTAENNQKINSSGKKDDSKKPEKVNSPASETTTSQTNRDELPKSPGTMPDLLVSHPEKQVSKEGNPSPSKNNSKCPMKRIIAMSSPLDTDELNFLFDLTPASFSMKKSPISSPSSMIGETPKRSPSISPKQPNSAPAFIKEPIFIYDFESEKKSQEKNPTERIIPKPPPRPSLMKKRSLPHGHLTDQMLREISRNLIEDEWIELGKNLNLSLIRLNVFKYNYLSRGNSESCFQMLVSWNKNGVESRRPLLREALRNIGRVDLISIIDDISFNKENEVRRVVPECNAEEQNRIKNRIKRNGHYVNEDDKKINFEDRNRRVPDTGEINHQTATENQFFRRPELRVANPRNRISDSHKRPIPSPRRLKPGIGLQLIAQKENRLLQQEIQKEPTIEPNNEIHEPPRIISEIVKQKDKKPLAEQNNQEEFPNAVETELKISKYNGTSEVFQPPKLMESRTVNSQEISPKPELQKCSDLSQKFISLQIPEDSLPLKESLSLSSIQDDLLNGSSSEIIKAELNNSHEVIPEIKLGEESISLMESTPLVQHSNCLFQNEDEVHSTPKLEKYIDPSTLNIANIQSLEDAIAEQECDHVHVENNVSIEVERKRKESEPQESELKSSKPNTEPKVEDIEKIENERNYELDSILNLTDDESEGKKVDEIASITEQRSEQKATGTIENAREPLTFPTCSSEVNVQKEETEFPVSDVPLLKEDELIRNSFNINEQKVEPLEDQNELQESGLKCIIMPDSELGNDDQIIENDTSSELDLFENLTDDKKEEEQPDTSIIIEPATEREGDESVESLKKTQTLKEREDLPKEESDKETDDETKEKQVDEIASINEQGCEEKVSDTREDFKELLTLKEQLENINEQKEGTENSISAVLLFEDETNKDAIKIHEVSHINEGYGIGEDEKEKSPEIIKELHEIHITTCESNEDLLVADITPFEVMEERANVLEELLTTAEISCAKIEEVPLEIVQEKEASGTEISEVNRHSLRRQDALLTEDLEQIIIIQEQQDDLEKNNRENESVQNDFLPFSPEVKDERINESVPEDYKISFIDEEKQRKTFEHLPRTSTPQPEKSNLKLEQKTEGKNSLVLGKQSIEKKPTENDPLSQFQQEQTNSAILEKDNQYSLSNVSENLSIEVSNAKENLIVSLEGETKPTVRNKSTTEEDMNLNKSLPFPHPEEIEMEVFELNSEYQNKKKYQGLEKSPSILEEPHLEDEFLNDKSGNDKNISRENVDDDIIQNQVQMQEEQRLEESEFPEGECSVEPEENVNENKLKDEQIQFALLDHLESISSEKIQSMIEEMAPYLIDGDDSHMIIQEEIKEEIDNQHKEVSPPTEAITKLYQLQREKYRDIQPFNMFWIQGEERRFETLYINLNFRLEECLDMSRREVHIEEILSSTNENVPQRILVSEKNPSDTRFLTSKFMVDWLRQECYAKFSLLFFVDLYDFENEIEEILLKEFKREGYSEEELFEAINSAGTDAVIVLYSSVKMDEEAVEAVFSCLDRQKYSCHIILFTAMRERFSPSRREELQQRYNESELSEIIEMHATTVGSFWNKHVEIMPLSLSKREKILQGLLNDRYKRFLTLVNLANAAIENVLEHWYFLTLLMTIMHKEEFDGITTHTRFYQQMIIFLTTKGAKEYNNSDNEIECQQLLANFGRLVYESLKVHHLKLNKRFSDKFHLPYGNIPSYCGDGTILKQGLLYEKCISFHSCIFDNLGIIHENFLDYFIALYLKTLSESDSQYEDFEIEMIYWFTNKIESLFVSFKDDNKPMDDSLMYTFLGGLLDKSFNRLLNCLKRWSHVLPVNREPMISLLTEVENLELIADNLAPFIPETWRIASFAFFSSPLHETLLKLGIERDRVRVLIWNPMDECALPSNLKIKKIVLKFIVTAERKDLRKLQKLHPQNVRLADAELISNSILSLSPSSNPTLNMTDLSSINNLSCDDLVLFVENFSSNLWGSFMNIVDQIERKRLSIVISSGTRSVLEVLTDCQNLTFHSFKALEIIEEKGRDQLLTIEKMIRSKRIRHHLTIQIQNWKCRGCEDTRIQMLDVENFFSMISRSSELKEFVFISDINYETMVSAYINRSILFNSTKIWKSLCIDGNIYYKKDKFSVKSLSIGILGLSDSNNAQVNATILSSFENIKGLKCSTELFQTLLPEMPGTWSGIISLQILHLSISKSKPCQMVNDTIPLPNLRIVCLDFQNIYNYSDASQTDLLKYPYLCVDRVIFKTVRSWNLSFITEFIQDLILTKKQNYGDLSNYSSKSDEADAAVDIYYGPLLNEIRIWFDEKPYLKDDQLKQFFNTINSLLTSKEIVVFSFIEPNKYLKELQSCFPAEEKFQCTREIEDISEEETLFAHHQPLYSAEAPDKLVIKKTE